MMLTNQVWMLQWIFLWIFKFISIDNLHCEPSIFIVSYGTKISHLTLCKERISIARSCIKNKWEKQFSSCSQENSLIADNPLGRGHRHSIYWNYFRDLAPVRDSWAPLRQPGMASEAFGTLGTLVGLVTILCPCPQWQLWALCCPPFTQTQISAAKSHLLSLPRTGIGVTRGNQMNSEFESRGQEEQQRNGRCFLGALSASPDTQTLQPDFCGSSFGSRSFYLWTDHKGWEWL